MNLNTETLQGRQLDGLLRSTNKRAQMRLTVDIRKPDGAAYHQTFRVKPWNGRDDHRMLTLDLNDGDWANNIWPTKVLHVDTTDGTLRPAKGMTDKTLLYAAEAAIRWASTGAGPEPTNGTVEVSTASICGYCGAELTHPVSLGLGIGPECAKSLGLEHHYRSQTLTGRARRGVRTARVDATEAIPAIETVEAVAA